MELSFSLKRSKYLQDAAFGPNQIAHAISQWVNQRNCVSLYKINIINILEDNPNILAASRLLQPLLRNPFAQVLISFVLGYYATTKLTQVCGHIRRLVDKKANPESECTRQLKDPSQNDPKWEKTEIDDREPLRLTQKQLTDYDGLHDNRLIYTALNGKIYDVSSRRETFYRPEGLYSLLAGCNANQVLSIAGGWMGVCTDDLVQRWEQSLNAEFNIIGYLIDTDDSDNSDGTKIDKDIAVINDGSHSNAEENKSQQKIEEF